MPSGTRKVTVGGRVSLRWETGRVLEYRARRVHRRCNDDPPPVRKSRRESVGGSGPPGIFQPSDTSVWGEMLPSIQIFRIHCYARRFGLLLRGRCRGGPCDITRLKEV
jgi:hypothetical protein